MAERTGKGNDVSLKWCPHCTEYVSKSTFYGHKSMYFKCNKWTKFRKGKAATDDVQAKEQTVISGEIPHFTDQENASVQSDNEESIAMDDDLWGEEIAEDELEVPSEEDQRPEIWNTDEDLQEDFTIRPLENEQQRSDRTNAVLAVFMHLIFAWQMRFCVSDNCIDSLLGMIGYLLTMLQSIFGFDELCHLIELFPNTKYKAKRFLGLDKDDFIKFVVCPTCDKLYSYQQACMSVDGSLKSKLCDYVPFPNHTQQKFREPCGTSLMKTVVSADGRRQVLYPKKVYCYQSLKTSIQRLLEREEIRSALMEPKKTHEDGFYDVYDGKIWKSMKDINGNLYSGNWRNLSVMFNIDWFQPFDGSEHSLGAMYMVLLNLPREMRFKKENMLLVGLIPGPKEPTRHVNTYLRPLVNELLSFWRGVYLSTNNESTLYRLAIVCISSDLPATRKCCGFLSYSAEKGCSKCWKKFPREGFGTKPDYSGFDFRAWIPRNGEQHKRLAEETQQAQTKTARANLYFDPIEFHVVDPMHNLLLGTAKHIFGVWIETGMLSDKDVDEIDKLSSEMGKMSEQGRTTKSLKLYKTMKAEEWKNWVLVYSLFCLKDVLDIRHFNLWQVYVRACRLLLSTSISSSQLTDAHQLLCLFCNQFEQIIGSQYCTPNMHMHLHLKDCINSFGPVYGFWAFSFERYNSVLGSFHTNNRSMTITMMRKFLDGVSVFAKYQQMGFKDLPCLADFNLTEEKHSASSTTPLDIIRRKPNLDGNDIMQVLLSSLSVPKLESLTDGEVQELTGMLVTLFPNENIKDISKFVRSYDRVIFGRELLCTERYRRGTSKDHFIHSRSRINGLNDLRPAKVASIFTVHVVLNTGRINRVVEITFMKVKFFEEHSQKDIYGSNCPMKIWSTSTLDHCIMPINFVQRKACITTAKLSYRDRIVDNCAESSVRVSEMVNFVI